MRAPKNSEETASAAYEPHESSTRRNSTPRNSSSSKTPVTSELASASHNTEAAAMPVT